MERSEVFNVIEGERKYQDIKWSEFNDENNHPADWIIYIENHLEQAKKAIYNSHDMESFGDEIRKIAALAVACGEQHGLPRRKKS